MHVGGLSRLDLNQASVETIYVTIWASPSVSLHLGKIENAEEIWRNHVGIRLQVSAWPIYLLQVTWGSSFINQDDGVPSLAYIYSCSGLILYMCISVLVSRLSRNEHIVAENA